MDPGEFIQVNAMARVDLEAEIELSKVIKAKKSSKFVRSTDVSILISENYRIMKCIQGATEDCE